MNDILFESCGVTEDGGIKIKFTNTEFDDIIFNIGEVTFSEDDDVMTMHFNYNVHEGVVEPEREAEFKQLIGDFLIQRIQEGVKKNDLIYHGGTDENRTEDPIEPDLQ